MDRETLADKMIHLVEMLSNPALEVPEDLRSAFTDREIAELKASGKFPDEGSRTGSEAISGPLRLSEP